nr:IS110 family transposase [Desulfobacter postgatei]
MLPECYMAPSELRELRRILRYRNHIVRTATQTKNKFSGLLMEVCAEYNKKKLHGKRYFWELMDTIEHVSSSVSEMLKLSRSNLEIFTNIQKARTGAKRKPADPRTGNPAANNWWGWRGDGFNLGVGSR